MSTIKTKKVTFSFSSSCWPILQMLMIRIFVPLWVLHLRSCLSCKNNWLSLNQPHTHHAFTTYQISNRVEHSGNDNIAFTVCYRGKDVAIIFM